MTGPLPDKDQWAAVVGPVLAPYTVDWEPWTIVDVSFGGAPDEEGGEGEGQEGEGREGGGREGEELGQQWTQGSGAAGEERLQGEQQQQQPSGRRRR